MDNTCIRPSKDNDTTVVLVFLHVWAHIHMHVCMYILSVFPYGANNYSLFRSLHSLKQGTVECVSIGKRVPRWLLPPSPCSHTVWGFPPDKAGCIPGFSRSILHRWRMNYQAQWVFIRHSPHSGSSCVGSLPEAESVGTGLTPLPHFLSKMCTVWGFLANSCTRWFDWTQRRQAIPQAASGWWREGVQGRQWTHSCWANKLGFSLGVGWGVGVRWPFLTQRQRASWKFFLFMCLHWRI